MDQCVKPTPNIDCDSEPIRKKAQELTEGLADPVEKAKAIFYFVRDQIRYNPYAYLYPIQASSILERGYGYCVQKAVLLSALARASGIPARLGFTDIRNHQLDPDWQKIFKSDVVVYHGFAELFLNEHWIKATPAFDLRMCRENGLIPVEFDGIQHALFHTVTENGEPHIEYVRPYGSFEDVPIDDIIEGVSNAYGEQFMECWRTGVWDAILQQ